MRYSISIEVLWDTLGEYRGVMGLSRSIEVSRDTLGVYRGFMGYSRITQRFYGILYEYVKVYGIL